MYKKYLYLLLIFFLNSCLNNNFNKEYCVDNNNFSISPIEGNISSLNKKIIMNSLINESGINVDQNSNKNIILDINIVKKASILSNNNTVNVESLNFIVDYKINDKVKNIVIDKGKIIIIDNIDILNDRFANYTMEENLINNFSSSLSIKLKNKIDMLLTKYSCKE